MVKNWIIKSISFVLLGLIIISCKTDQTKVVEKLEVEKIELPSLMEEVLDAHGGLDTWNSMGTLSYELVKEEGNEEQIIDLKNRKVKINASNWELGFDGTDVWVTPDMETFGRKSARFYHNLLFYFYAIPYVLADPGVNYEVREPVEMLGMNLLQIATSFNSGVGDAPEDEYILLIDEKTKQLKVILYTVTYYSKEKGKSYNALVYDNYKDVNGLLFPENLKGYKYKDGQLGEERYIRSFTNIKTAKNQPDQSVFAVPEGAVIDPLK